MLTHAAECEPDLGELLGQAILALVEPACYYTAKLVLPLISFGRLRALDAAEFSFWGTRRAPAFERLPGGKIGIDAGLAGLLRFIFWLGAVIALLA
jgi:hypothetical protein